MSPTKEIRNTRQATTGEPFDTGIKLQWSQPFPLGRGGLNAELPGNELNPDQASALTNAKVTFSGLEVAWGYTEIGSAIGDTDKVVRHINLYRELDETTYLIRITNDFIYRWNGSNWSQAAESGGSAMSGTGKLINSAMVQDSLLVCNGADTVRRYQGATGNGAITELSSDAPAAYFIVPYADRAVVARTDANPQLIQWSVSGDITDWTSTGAGSTSLVDDPTGAMDEIMGLTVHNDFLTIYRRHSIWVGTRTGDPTPPIRFQSRVQGQGAIAERSITNVGSAGDVFLGRDDVYLFHPSFREPQRIGTPIRSELFDDLNTSQLQNVHGAYVTNTNEFWLFVPTGSNTYADRAYVLDVRKLLVGEKLVWARRDIASANNPISASDGVRTGSLTDSDSPHKLALGTSVGETFDSDSSDTTDDGETITLTYESPEFSLPSTWVQLGRLAIGYTADSEFDITIDTSIDGGDNWDTSVTYTLKSSTGVTRRVFWIRSAFGKSVMFRLRTSTTTQPILRTYSLGLFPRGMVRR